MIHYTCDLCGRSLKDRDVIYELNIEVHAIYQPLQIDLVDMLKDHTDEIRGLIEELKDKDPQELQDQIYKTFKFHLCPPCQQKYIKNPFAPIDQAGSGDIEDSAPDRE
ncbi:MAG: hypothetical protein Q8Q12_10065 [bacterium]|nr:hypothetical protein [bacterium]